MKKSVTIVDTTIISLQNEASTEEKRKQHQKELASHLNEEAKLRLAQQKVIANYRFQDVTAFTYVYFLQGKLDGDKVRKSTISYKSAKDLPKDDEVKELKIFVGESYSTP